MAVVYGRAGGHLHDGEPGEAIQVLLRSGASIEYVSAWLAEQGMPRPEIFRRVFDGADDLVVA